MNKFVTVAAAGALALVASFSATAPSSAHSMHNGAGLAAGIFGFMVGAAAASAYENDRYYHDGYFGGYGWDDHIAACADAYRSYNIRTDSYLGYDGYRHRCEL